MWGTVVQNAAMEAMLTMLLRLRSTISETTTREHGNIPLTFTAKTRSQSSMG